MITGDFAGGISAKENLSPNRNSPVLLQFMFTHLDASKTYTMASENRAADGTLTYTQVGKPLKLRKGKTSDGREYVRGYGRAKL